MPAFNAAFSEPLTSRRSIRGCRTPVKNPSPSTGWCTLRLAEERGVAPVVHSRLRHFALRSVCRIRIQAADMTTGPPAFPGIRTADTAQQQVKQEPDVFFFGVNPNMPTQPAGPFQAPHNSVYGVPAGAGFGPNAYSTSSSYGANWRENDAVVQGRRTRNVVLIEQMLSSHAPHDVLTQVPENVDWHSKTFQLAVKVERLMFNTAASRDDYLNESTLRTRVQNLSRNLIQLRKRKNVISENFATLSMS
ncbi:hypothetical protein PHYPSEUDO_010571 [Phytophthora pseudosyringae]|uniref:Mediator complex subunit 15 KIX domain-containing protein n=1 Tax=Phytophthora pseudosyringae TaxID=221518 RepID=A0A8T1VF36_9STRA|nr:hypothetical protein PHYPSEUDO_010571 [Phytophthora pseudosyringae]